MPSNGDSIRTMDLKTANPNCHFLTVPGTSHFSILAPINDLLAQKIVSDTGPTCSITLAEQEINVANSR